jgi:hypothetical protein
MGIFSRNKPGWNCRASGEDGKVTCTRFNADKDQRVATGTEITVGVNSETCEAFFTGAGNAMLDEDEDAINDIANKLSLACKKKKGTA